MGTRVGGFVTFGWRGLVVRASWELGQPVSYNGRCTRRIDPRRGTSSLGPACCQQQAGRLIYNVQRTVGYGMAAVYPVSPDGFVQFRSGTFASAVCGLRAGLWFAGFDDGAAQVVGGGPGGQRGSVRKPCGFW